MPLKAELTTRKLRNDPHLVGAGWLVTPFRPESPVASYERAPVEEYETSNGPADYALCDDGRIEGVDEAPLSEFTGSLPLFSAPSALQAMRSVSEQERQSA